MLNIKQNGQRKTFWKSSLAVRFVLERWQSGLMRPTVNRVNRACTTVRGSESHPLRDLNAPPVAGNYQRGLPSNRSPMAGLVPAANMDLRPEKVKGRSDLPAVSEAFGAEALAGQK